MEAEDTADAEEVVNCVAITAAMLEIGRAVLPVMVNRQVGVLAWNISEQRQFTSRTLSLDFSDFEDSCSLVKATARTNLRWESVRAQELEERVLVQCSCQHLQI